MRVAVVGAGMAGLAAARELVAGGNEVVVFEKSRGFGGRAATRRKEGFVWDTGAGYIEEPMRAYAPGEGLFRVDKPVWLYNGGDPRPDRPTPPRYAYEKGNNALGRGLAQGIDVRREQRIETLAGLRDDYDAIVVATPIPQAIPLLESIGEMRDLVEIRYRSCFAVCLGYDAPMPECPYTSLMARDEPLGWLSLEGAKCPGRAPEGCASFVAQLSERFSADNYERPHEELVEIVAGYLRELYGMERPVVSEVMRWRYSQPIQTGALDTANPSGTRVVLASDGLTGGKLHHAYEAGLRAAHLLQT